MNYAQVHPKKSLGQNFLKDENIARKIIASLNLKPGDCVLEIGSGTGILTKYLVQSATKVVGVEIDKNLVAQLLSQYSSATNFLLYQNDILKVSFKEILPGEQRWKAVANLPYHITSPVLFKLIEQRHFFESATLMVQQEVAQRMVAKPSTKAYGILSVFSQCYAETQILFDVSRHVFFPKPEVTSAVVRLEFNKPGLLNEYDEPVFRQVVRGTFNQRRKMLRNSLLAIPDLDLDLDKINFDLKQRPEQLSVSDFVELTKQIVRQISNLSYN
ncbi:MAG: 16S rRNA (adenine(1518)-N(6)/adenine(1519)-N(6))-dimethyltransferase RsmA [bacterium]|nr:16S rRNA (adenine(1518)-N(6)/adenine(1519)-N(6))-dimethyltransferase RsmA [bacterium]